MSVNYYSAISALAFLILLIENQDLLFLNRKGAFEKPAWKVYRHFLFTVLVYYLTDVFWGILEFRKQAALLFADTSVYFVSMAVGILFWTKFTVVYLEVKNAFGRFLIYAGRGLAAIVAGLVVANYFTPILFTVDDACVYTALKARYAVLTAQILLLLAISAYALTAYLRRHSASRLRFRTLSLFGAVMALFLFAQLWFPYLPLYAIAYMLGTSLLRAYILGDEKELYRQELAEANRSAEINRSFEYLMKNMPSLSFSKDAETGAYLVCNQSFAEYAQKKSPDEVIGLTDDDLFDEATAAHFARDDRRALEMDEPYVLLESVTDAAGNPRKFQTTKLKFYDAHGKLCLLGMSVDVTELEQVRKESEQARQAYEKALSDSAIHENMLVALSSDYFDLYYVDLQTDDYIEYGSRFASGRRSAEKQGKDFFASARQNARRYIYLKDRERLIEALDKENMLSEIRRNGTFVIQYRLRIQGEPTYVSMKAACIRGDEQHMIIGVRNIDAQIRDHMSAQQAVEERRAYERLNALVGNLLVLYIVDPEDGQFTEYNASSDFKGLGIEQQGTDFFKKSYENGERVVHPDDLKLYRSLVTKQNILAAIQRDGMFVLNYRLVIDGRETHIKFKAVQVEEDGKPLLVIGLLNIDAQVRQGQEFAKDLSSARQKATLDALTGVKNKFAYLDAARQLNAQIRRHEPVDFAVVVCDVNNLKVVNDTQGHAAGDQLIQDACARICDVFQHSPVFRIGGDEFAVLCQGRDYTQIDRLTERMNEENVRSKPLGKVQVAYGMARFRGEANVEAVFERADQLMYTYKAKLKAAR